MKTAGKNSGRQELAAKGEALADEFLRNKKYRILDKNYRCPLGEIDLVAEQNKVIVFVEVKTRSSQAFGQPEEAVTRAKQKKLGQLAEYYFKAKNLGDREMRFDVISILANSRDGTCEISHFENAFEF